MNHLNSLAAVIDVEMSLEMKRSQSSLITQEKSKGRNCCLSCLNLDQLLIYGKLPLRGTFVLHTPPSSEGSSLNKVRYSSILGCVQVTSSPGCCSVMPASLALTSHRFPVPEAIVSQHLFCSWSPTLPLPTRFRWLFPRPLRLPGLYGSIRRRGFAGNSARLDMTRLVWGFVFFSSSFPGLLLTQMSSPAWHNEGGDGGKGWQGLRHYQEKKH